MNDFYFIYLAILILVSLVLITRYTYYIFHPKAVPKWLPTKAKVNEIKYNDRADDPTGRYVIFRPRKTIWYEYNVGKKIYSGKDTSYSYKFYPKNELIDIVYNPLHPNRSVLKENWTIQINIFMTKSFWLWLVIVALVAFGIWAALTFLTLDQVNWISDLISFS